MKDPDKKSFYSVAMFLIIVGAALFAFGIVCWLFNYFGGTSFNYPAGKIMGGLIILALGYLLAELELTRRK